MITSIESLYRFFRGIAIPSTAVLIIVYLLLIVIGTLNGNNSAISSAKKIIVTTLILIAIMFMLPSIVSWGINLAKSATGGISGGLF